MQSDALSHEPARAGVLVRAGLPLVLLVAELFVLSVRFDGESLSRRSDWWAPWLGVAPSSFEVASFVAAFLLMASPRLKSIMETLAHASIERRWVRWLSLHLVAIGAFALCTAQLFEGGAESTVWVVGWVITAGAAPTFWLLSLAPAPYWWTLARRERRAIVLAALTGTAAAVSARVTQTLWNWLAGATFWLGERLLATVYSPIVSDPAERMLGTPRFQVSISPECSGYEGIALMSVFVSLYVWMFRRSLRFPHALLLLPAGVLAIWLANALRIALLIAIGTSLSPSIALGGFHSQAGWLSFLAVSMGLMMAAHRIRLFVPRDAAELEAASPPAGSTDAAALLMPALVLLASVMLTSAASSGFDRWYPLRLVATAAALWHFRAAYRRFDWRWTWQSTGIGATVFILWIALETFSAAHGEGIETGPAQLSPGEAGLWLTARVLGSVVTVPLAEEPAFRGYLIRKLVSPAFETVPMGQFTWLSFVGSSVAFGLLHGRWIAGTLAGMAFALALYRRGQISDAVYAHATANALIAVYVLWAGRWSLWS